jgi:hypothetical protein
MNYILFDRLIIIGVSNDTAPVQTLIEETIWVSFEERSPSSRAAAM